MKSLVVFESFFGNTEKIARAIGGALEAAGGQVEVVRVSEVQPEQLRDVDLLVIGSATRAFGPSEGTKGLLRSLAVQAVSGKRVAAFDTRANLETIKSGLFRSIVGKNFAAPKISKRLVKLGGQEAAAPEGFLVMDSEGPLCDGELERAAAWGQGLIKA